MKTEEKISAKNKTAGTDEIKEEKKTLTATEHIQLKNLPKILVVHLKRFFSTIENTTVKLPNRLVSFYYYIKEVL